MGDDRASTKLSGKALQSRLGIEGRAVERLRHAFWAGAISLVLLAASILSPLDQFFWIIQSRLAGHQPSGEIVFVAADAAVVDPLMGHRRGELADALIELDRLGVSKIYLDLVFDEPSGAPQDRKLGDAIARLGPRIVLVDRENEQVDGQITVRNSIRQIAGTASRVVDADDTNWLGFVWTMPYSRTYDGRSTQSFGSALSGHPPHGDGKFQVDYGIYHHDIPAVDLEDLTTDKGGSTIDFAGKTVVIGKGEIANASRVIPGQAAVPESYVAIFAAETLKSGRTWFVGALWMLLSTLLVIVGTVTMVTSERRRKVGYALTALMLPVSLVVAARLGVRIEIAYSLATLLIYASFRWRARWKQRVAMIDQDTGLPTLRALEMQITQAENCRGHVVIAKVHGYEHVVKTLPLEGQTTYILKLVDRLRAADKELSVYFAGHFLGWHAQTDDSDALVEHLEGLRAIFAAPIQVGGHVVDVGITFGLARIDGDRIRRIPAAIAAAEETSEAHEPIKIAESGSQIDMLWDLSLRARIDEAMEVGEVYCVYQPKVDIRTGQMVGVEALVRWHDPARGFISPIRFIRQCENAGRMEHLTRYVLQSACTAGKLLHLRGEEISMAVNISATLLGDMRIVGVVRNVLQATGFNPASLTLEVTETARISDMSTAASILTELKAIGLSISIDDFGVGAANYETFYQLPFDELKIDRLFVSNLADDPKARSITASIVAMGKEARIAVVAEGVETAEELRILNEMGCDYVQGYAISRPVSLSNLLEYKAKPQIRQVRNMV